MRVKRNKSFLKSYGKLTEKIQEKTDKILIQFSINPFDKSLRNHALYGKYEGCRSLDITGDYRVIFRELSGGTYELIELLMVGTHSQLYG